MKNNIIKRENIEIVDEEENISITGMQSKEKEPEIIVNKKEGVIESIDVICSCGRKIHIVCEYEEPVTKIDT